MTILSVGNLIPVKGHAVLLRAFARVLSNVADCRMQIIGSGPEAENLTRLTETLGIASRVSFLGRQSRDFVADAMKRCAIFALPSRYEGLGCVYLEAMASGKPVIACTGQGVSDIIEDGKNGILVSPDNERELANAMETLLRNQDFRGRLGASARSTILAAHTVKHQAEKLMQVYKEIVL
jgi:glycosyltransferase involved in cell wall biosynthesis